MDVELRPLAAGDDGRLSEYLYLALFVPSGSLRPPRGIVRRPELARYVSNWGRPGDVGLVAIEGRSGRDVGAAWLRLWPGDEKGYGFIDSKTPELTIAVKPRHRGQGIGSLLLDRILACAGALYPAVSLSVANANPAVRLYTRFGFVPVVSTAESTTMRRVLGR